MSTSWSLTATEICTDALEHLGAIADGETPSAGDLLVCLRGLDGLLKELPTFGYLWPRLSTETNLTYASSSLFALPADYYGFPLVWTRASGERIQLTPFTTAEWNKIANLPTTVNTVTHFYITPSGQLYVYPLVSADPVLTMQYARVIDDASLTATPAVMQIWKNPLGYGVANEVAMKFGATKDRRQEILARWIDKRDRALESSQGFENIVIEVAE